MSGVPERTRPGAGLVAGERAAPRRACAAGSPRAVGCPRPRRPLRPTAETSSGSPTTSVTGRPRRTSGRCLAVEQPLRPPDRHRQQRCAGLTRQRHRAGHERAHGPGPAHAGLGEHPDRLTLPQQPSGVEVRRGRGPSVDRNVAHAGHEAARGPVLEHLVPGQEPHQTAAAVGRETDEQEVEEADVVGREHHRPVPRHVLVARQLDAEVQRAQRHPTGADDAAVEAVGHCRLGGRARRGCVRRDLTRPWLGAVALLEVGRAEQVDRAVVDLHAPGAVHRHDDDGVRPTLPEDGRDRVQGVDRVDPATDRDVPGVLTGMHEGVLVLEVDSPHARQVRDVGEQLLVRHGGVTHRLGRRADAPGGAEEQGESAGARSAEPRGGCRWPHVTPRPHTPGHDSEGRPSAALRPDLAPVDPRLVSLAA